MKAMIHFPYKKVTTNLWFAIFFQDIRNAFFKNLENTVLVVAAKIEPVFESVRVA